MSMHSMGANSTFSAGPQLSGMLIYCSCRSAPNFFTAMTSLIET